MRFRALFLIVAIIIVFAAPLVADSAGNVVAVRQFEIGYRLGDAGMLRVRVTLASGEALEFTTTSPEETQTVLRLAVQLRSRRDDRHGGGQESAIASVRNPPMNRPSSTTAVDNRSLEVQTGLHGKPV